MIAGGGSSVFKNFQEVALRIFPVLMMDIKVSKDKYISRWVDQENLFYFK